MVHDLYRHCLLDEWGRWALHEYLVGPAHIWGLSLISIIGRIIHVIGVILQIILILRKVDLADRDRSFLDGRIVGSIGSFLYN